MQENLANVHPILDCHPTFDFGLGFLAVICINFVVLVRHFALGLELLKTIPAVSMLKTKCYQNWRITREQQAVVCDR